MRHGILNGKVACDGRPLTELVKGESAIDTARLVTCVTCKTKPSDRPTLSGVFS